MRSRVLPKDEWSRLDGDRIPLLFPYLTPDQADIIVVEDANETILGGITVSRPTHLEGLWLDSGGRNAGARRALLRGIGESVADRYVISCASDRSISGMLERLGGIRMRQEFYTLDMCEVKKWLQQSQR